MMKNIIVFVAIIVMTTMACNKSPLDITPDGRMVLDDVFTDEVLTEAFLNRAYRNIPSYGWHYNFWDFLANETDEAQDADNFSKWHTGSLSVAHNPLNILQQGVGADRYPTMWQGIRDANVFLANIGTAAVKSEEFRSRFTAEAHALRAFFYFELIKQFGPMPIVETTFAAGFDFDNVKRPTFQENIDFIVKDCDIALANAEFPIRLTSSSEAGRFTKAVAHMIKSHALLYNASPLWNPEGNIAKWTAAANASKAALAELTAGDTYELYSNYGDYFISEVDYGTSRADRETILVRPGFGGPLSIISGIASMPGNTNAGVCPSQELVDAYEMHSTGEPVILGYSDADHLVPIINPNSGYDENNPYVGRDPRFYANIWHNGALYDNIAGSIHTIETFIGGADQIVPGGQAVRNTVTGYYMRKFINPQWQAGQGPAPSWKIYRLAKIYLNLAEAENEANGPTAAAYDAVNAIRRRADMPDFPTGLSKEQFRERVRNERRIELAFEEDRFWDVRRWRILDQTDKIITGMMIRKEGDGSFIYERFVLPTGRRNAWQDKFLMFPIPSPDASIVKDFRLNQNPGW